MTGATRRTEAVISLAAVAANVRAVRAALAPGTMLWAVVKANAYGHGAVPVALAALRAGADALAVALPEEGWALRRAGIASRILVLGPILPEQAGGVVSADLEAIAFSPPVIDALGAAAQVAGRRVAVHLKVDTGMGRVGAAPQDVPALAERLGRWRSIEWAGLMTHLSDADHEDATWTGEQYRQLLRVVERLRQRGWSVPVHAANSAAALRFPGLQADGVRAGLALYGLEPWPGAPPLSPAMELTSVVTMVKPVPRGFAVGYGHTYRAPAPQQIATVAAGYADGVRRALSNRGAALVGGLRAPIVGRISMDQLTLAVPLAAPVHVGDPVVLLGRQGSEAIRAGDWAEWLGTISYEVVCGISDRVPRVYRDPHEAP